MTAGASVQTATIGKNMKRLSDYHSAQNKNVTASHNAPALWKYLRATGNKHFVSGVTAQQACPTCHIVSPRADFTDAEEDIVMHLYCHHVPEKGNNHTHRLFCTGSFLHLYVKF